MTHTAYQIVEAMARATYERDPLWSGNPTRRRTWEDISEDARVEYRADACAAYAECLKQMQEPIDTEFDAAWELLRSDQWQKLASRISIHDARTFFKAVRRAMIDERIKELG